MSVCVSDVQAQIQQQQQQGDPNREQNDYQVPTSELNDASYPSNQHNATHPARDPGHAPDPHLTSRQATNTYPHQHPNHHHRQQGHHLPGEFWSNTENCNLKLQSISMSFHKHKFRISELLYDGGPSH